MSNPRLKSALALGLAALVLSGCSRYVTRDEFDVVVGELRGEDAKIRTENVRLRSDMVAFRKDLASRFQNYDAKFTEVEGRMRVDMTAHFDAGKTELRDADKAQLKKFAAIVKDRAPNAVVTVEGFTDSKGPKTVNRKIGLARAQAVRDFLVAEGGLPADRVRAVSYGEDPERLIVKDKESPLNRRVAIVIDYLPSNI